MSDYKLTRDAAGKVTTQYGQMLKNLDGDLVKQARHNANADMPHHASVSLIEEMADRIEDLEANALANRLAIMRLEAKLAKAVEALKSMPEAVVHTTLDDGPLWPEDRIGVWLAAVHACKNVVQSKVDQTIAELKGQDDE
jgi:hypothetical protein